MAIVIPLRVELEICAVICGSQIHYVNVWEEICVHALNTKKIAFAGVMLALTEVGIALGSVIETNTLFLLAAASFFVGIVIQEFGLKSGAGFLLAGILLAILLSPNKLYVVSYAFMGFYILIIETIWHFSGRASGWIRSRNFFWLMKYLVFNVLYIPGLIYFWSMLSEKKTAKGIMLMSVVFGQFILFVFDKTYEYAMGKIWKENRHKFGF